MDNPEKERQLDALKVPRHRLDVVGAGIHLLAENSVVRAGIALRDTLSAPETPDTVQRPQFPNHRIVEMTEQSEMLEEAYRNVRGA